MSGARPPIAPVLLAAWPALFVAGNNPGEFSATEVVAAALIGGLLGALCGVLGNLIARDRARASLVSIALVAGLYAPFLLARMARIELLRSHARVPLLPLLFVAILLLCVARALRGGERVASIARFATASSVALVAIAAVTTLRSLWQAHPGVDPPGVPPAARAARADAPDIYVIVLDQYASAAVLRERFGIDNAAFEDSLRRRGFHLPRAAWSNYSFTAASVASLLDMRHVVGAADSVPRGERSLLAYHRIIDRADAFRLAREHGYRIVFIPSPSFEGTRDHPAADRVVRPTGGVAWLAAQVTSPLALELADLSVAGWTLRRLGIRPGNPWRELAPFAGLRAAVQEPGPKLVFAHAMTTHQPFWFTPSCTWARIAPPDFARQYEDQIRCTNRLLLALVDDIARSGRPSVVLLQGDHGTGWLGAGLLPQADRLSAAQAAERFGAFSAHRVPDGGALGDTVTPVNALRLVFNRYLHASLPLQPNTAWHAVSDRQYEFVPVDPRVLSVDGSRSTAAGSGVLWRAAPIVPAGPARASRGAAADPRID